MGAGPDIAQVYLWIALVLRHFHSETLKRLIRAMSGPDPALPFLKKLLKISLLLAFSYYLSASPSWPTVRDIT